MLLSRQGGTDIFTEKKPLSIIISRLCVASGGDSHKKIRIFLRNVLVKVCPNVRVMVVLSTLITLKELNFHLKFILRFFVNIITYRVLNFLNNDVRAITIWPKLIFSKFATKILRYKLRYIQK